MRAARQGVGLVALLTALALPASAPAQSGDPAEGSPSGVIYEIPLDNARQDAAPTRTTAGAGAQGGTISPIRSENGFGSSSTVPGATAGNASSSGGGKSKSKSKTKSGGTGGSGAGGGGSAGGSGADGQGSGGAAAPGTAAEGIRGAGSASVTPSKSRAYLLLLLALLVAVGLGVAGRYVARRR